VFTCHSNVTERMDDQQSVNYDKCILSVLAYIYVYVISVVVLNLKHMDEEADI